MSKLKVIFMVIAFVAIAALSALGAAKVDLGVVFDLAVGAGGIVSALIAVLKKE